MAVQDENGPVMPRDDAQDVRRVYQNHARSFVQAKSSDRVLHKVMVKSDDPCGAGTRLQDRIQRTELVRANDADRVCQ